MPTLLRLPIFFRPPIIRHLFFVLLLAIEIGVLSIQLDTQSFEEIKLPLLDILGYSGDFLKIAIGAVGAFIILSISRIREMWQLFISHSKQTNWKLWALLHLILMAVFYQLSYQIFEVIPEEEILNVFKINLVVISWALVGMGAICLWIMVYAPYTYWHRFIQQEGKTIVISCFASFLAWYLGQFSEMAWKFFANLTFWTTHSTLQIFYSDVVFDVPKKILGTSSFKVIINSECSGYEGIGLVVVFLSLYLWMARERLRYPHVYLLFPMGIVAIWGLNALRIVSLIAIGSSWSQEIALGGFHSNAGWVAFVMISIALVWGCHSFAFFNKKEEGSTQTVTSSSGILATTLILPIVVLLAGLLITSSFVTTFDWLYPVRIIAAGSVLWFYRSQYLVYVKNITAHSIIIGVVVFIIWLLIVPYSESISTQFSLELINNPPLWVGLWLIIRVIGACLVIPIVEELAFRGYLISKLVNRQFTEVKKGQFTGWSFIISSLLFGVLHSEWVAGTVAGMLFAVALYRRGEVFDAIVAHMTANLLLASYVLITGSWSFW